MISIVRTAVAAAALAAVAPAAAAAQPAKAAAAKPAARSALALPTLERFRLDNGLEVAFMPLPGAPAISVQVWYHVGSKDEPRDRRGSAHMFEHMMFKGSQRVRAEDPTPSRSRPSGCATSSSARRWSPPSARS
jgi:zinc protease